MGIDSGCSSCRLDNPNMPSYIPAIPAQFIAQLLCADDVLFRDCVMLGSLGKVCYANENIEGVSTLTVMDHKGKTHRRTFYLFTNRSDSKRQSTATTMDMMRSKTTKTRKALLIMIDINW